MRGVATSDDDVTLGGEETVPFQRTGGKEHLPFLRWGLFYGAGALCVAEKEI